MKTRKEARKKRHMRIRKKVLGTAKRPRVSVFRSHKFIYAQLVDDSGGVTLIGISDRGQTEKNKRVRAKNMGLKLAGSAKTLKLTEVVFDRSGYAYHGRVQALAEGLREGGLKF